MKFCFIADTHGDLPTKIDPCYALCICGDLVPLNVQGSTVKTKRWVLNTFIPWAQEVPCDMIFIVPGNHDIHLKESMFSSCDKVRWLVDESYEYFGIKIYGTPWCKQFGDWAYMLSNESLVRKYKNIPNDTDILLTHDAPYGASDIILQPIAWNTGDHIGNIPLRDAILEKNPKYCIHGHLHTTNHEREILGNTDVYCCSLVDEYYKTSYLPLYLEINNDRN